VTVTAVQDDIEEVDVPHFGTITHVAASADGDYDAISVADVVATITDDDQHGIELTPASPTLTVDEANIPASASYTVRLRSEPTDAVTITLASLNGEITFENDTLAFTPGNWNTAQTV